MRSVSFGLVRIAIQGLWLALSGNASVTMNRTLSKRLRSFGFRSMNNFKNLPKSLMIEEVLERHRKINVIKVVFQLRYGHCSYYPPQIRTIGLLSVSVIGFCGGIVRFQILKMRP